MIRALSRAMAVAAIGAAAAAAAAALAFVLHPAFTLEMDRDLPRNVTGLYPPERTADGSTFAWTGRDAKLNLPGLDRRVPWTCVVRVRGGRAAPLPQPRVEIDVDGISAASRAASNELEEMQVDVPARPGRAGLILIIASSTTVVPGPSDPRELGVQLDRLECRPASAIALPPRRTMAEAMLAGAAFGAAFGAIGITAGSAVGAVLALAVIQAFPFGSGPAPYTAYADRASSLALWIGAAMVALVGALQLLTRQPLRQTARFVIAFHGRGAVHHAARAASSIEAARRRRVSRAPLRSGPGGPVLLYAAAGRRRHPVSVCDRPLPVRGSVGGVDAGPRHAAAAGRLHLTSGGGNALVPGHGEELGRSARRGRRGGARRRDSDRLVGGRQRESDQRLRGVCRAGRDGARDPLVGAAGLRAPRSRLDRGDRAGAAVSRQHLRDAGGDARHAGRPVPGGEAGPRCVRTRARSWLPPRSPSPFRSSPTMVTSVGCIATPSGSVERRLSPRRAPDGLARKARRRPRPRPDSPAASSAARPSRFGSPCSRSDGP